MDTWTNQDDDDAFGVGSIYIYKKEYERKEIDILLMICIVFHCTTCEPRRYGRRDGKYEWRSK